jgi:hypothetical protein
MAATCTWRGRVGQRSSAMLPGERVDRALELVDFDLVTHHLVDEQRRARGEAIDGVVELAKVNGAT